MLRDKIPTEKIRFRTKLYGIWDETGTGLGGD